MQGFIILAIKGIEKQTLVFYSMQNSDKSNRKAMNRNWSNLKANPALKTKAGNK